MSDPSSEEVIEVPFQASMSWTWLLFECPFPFGAPFHREPAVDAARYGTAFHQVMARTLLADGKSGKAKPRAAWVDAAAKKHSVSPEGMLQHVQEARAYLQKWLGGTNEFKIDFLGSEAEVLIERALALKPLASGRAIDLHDDAHIYHGVRRGEQPGTLDYARRPVFRLTGKASKPAPLLLLDHKTGESEDFSRPLEVEQLLSLGAAAMRTYGAEEAVLGILHTRREGLPKIYAERVRLHELQKHEKKVKRQLARIGDGSMRPGKWCERCPARDGCPARDSHLLARAGDILTGLTVAGGMLSSAGLQPSTQIIKAPSNLMTVEAKLGLLYAIARLAKIMDGRARAEIKKAIEDSGGTLVPEVPETGEDLVLRTFTKESLSKTSVMAAYGKTAGERVLERLRKAGAIKASPVTQLWPQKARGR